MENSWVGKERSTFWSRVKELVSIEEFSVEVREEILEAFGWFWLLNEWVIEEIQVGEECNCELAFFGAIRAQRNQNQASRGTESQKRREYGKRC